MNVHNSVDIQTVIKTAHIYYIEYKSCWSHFHFTWPDHYENIWVFGKYASWPVWYHSNHFHSSDIFNTDSHTHSDATRLSKTRVCVFRFQTLASYSVMLCCFSSVIKIQRPWWLKTDQTNHSEHTAHFNTGYLI